MKKKIFSVFWALVLVVSFSLVAAVPAAANGGPPATLYVSKWTEYATNPVFDPTEKAYYPTILFDGTTYQIWYADETGIRYTTSSGGITWAAGVPVTGLTPVGKANHPLVEYIDGKYIMWYWDDARSVLYSINAIRYAESTDGTTWGSDQPLTQVGTTVIATAGWNIGSYGPCDVLYNPAGSDTIVVPVNAASVWVNKFVMYYDGTTGGAEAIGLAVSAAGKQWQGYKGGVDPVLTGGGVGAWDRQYASRCTVLKNGSTYHMLYSGGVLKVNHGIGHATSADGLTWTKDPNNPYLHKDDGVLWRNDRTYCPAVIKDGGVYKMWFSGTDAATGNYAIGYATNTNLDADYDTIQAAVNAAQAGDTISIADGTYTLSSTLNLTLASLKISGSSESRVIINARSVSGYGIAPSAGGITLEKFTLLGPAADAATSYGIKASHMNNLTIRNVTVKGSGRSEIDLNTVVGGLLENATTDGQNTKGVGIAVSHSNNIILRNITTLNNVWGGVGLFDTAEGPTTDVIFDGTNNFGEANPIYIDAEFGPGASNIALPAGFGYAVRNTVFRDAESPNRSEAFTFFQSSRENAISFALSLQTAPFPANSASYIQTVGVGGALVNNFIVGNGMSIQTAINPASPGGTINVAAGTYDEQVVIDKSLTLQGAGDTTIVKPSSAAKLTEHHSISWTGGTKEVAGVIVVNQATGSVTIKNLKVDGDNITIVPPGANWVTGILYRESGGVIDNVTAVNMTIGNTGLGVRGYGIYVYSADSLVSTEIKGSRISNYDKNGINAQGQKLTANIHHNTVTGRGPLPDGDEVQNGVLIIDNATGTVNNNTVLNNAYEPADWGATGIVFVNAGGSAQGNTLTDNQMGAAAQILSGFGSGTSWTVSFSGNTVNALGLSVPGITGLNAATYVNGVTLNVTMDDNQLTGGPGDGISIGDLEGLGPAGSVVATINNNTISSWQHGIHLVSSVAAGSTITGNTITNNTGLESGIHIEAGINATNVSVNFNNIFGNATYGVNNGDTGTLNVKNNWWGTKDGAAIATMVFGPVNYTPWTGAPVENSKTETVTDNTVDAKTEADTDVDVTGTATVTVAKYSSNPGSGFGGDTGKYVDVHIDDPAGVTEIKIRLYYTDAEIAGLVESSLRLRWWDGTSWVNCSDSGVNTTDISGPPPYSGYMWAKIRNDTIPTLAQLTGTAFGGGGVAAGGGGGGGGGQGGLPAAYAAYPVTLASDMKGEITTVKMTNQGVLCKACLAKDAAGKHTLQLDEGAKVMLAGNIVPLILRFREASVTLPTPENTVIVGPVYEFNAYSSTFETTPSPVTISPPAKLILTYDPDKLPKNVSEVFIANYDTEKGWLALAPVPGVVAEIDKAYGLVSHFTPFAVLAKLTEPAPAKFEASNLTVSPSQAQLNQEVTISLNVANTGGTSGSYSLELKVNGISKSSKQVTVAAGTSQTVNFTITGDAAGKHQVEVAGLAGEFEIIKAAKQSQINWWLIGGIIGIILLIIIGLVVRRRQLRGY